MPGCPFPLTTTIGTSCGGDAATWLPPASTFRCTYVARQVAVKAKYRLWVTAAERDAIAEVLSACHGQELPPDSGIAVQPSPDGP